MDTGRSLKLWVRLDEFFEGGLSLGGQADRVFRVAAAPAGEPLGAEEAGISGMRFRPGAVREGKRGG